MDDGNKFRKILDAYSIDIEDFKKWLLSSKKTNIKSINADNLKKTLLNIHELQQGTKGTKDTKDTRKRAGKCLISPSCYNGINTDGSITNINRIKDWRPPNNNISV